MRQLTLASQAIIEKHTGHTQACWPLIGLRRGSNEGN